MVRSDPIPTPVPPSRLSPHPPSCQKAGVSPTQEVFTVMLDVYGKSRDVQTIGELWAAMKVLDWQRQGGSWW